jgi:hypothetical protein
MTFALSQFALAALIWGFARPILKPIAIVPAVLGWLLVVTPGVARDRNVPAEFQRQFPCASTGKTTGPCPGYTKDHVIPLACGGPDSVANMQYQTVEEAKKKDRWELECWRWWQQ